MEFSQTRRHGGEMATRASGIFKSGNWDEQTFQELEGDGKLTRATANFSYSGDIEGECITNYLMVYPSGGVVHFVGLDWITGTIGGRSGSFVLQESGTYAPEQLTATWFVVPGSGTGALTGLNGTGSYTHQQSDGDDVSYTLDYAFA